MSLGQCVTEVTKYKYLFLCSKRRRDVPYFYPTVSYSGEPSLPETEKSLNVTSIFYPKRNFKRKTGRSFKKRL